VSPARPSQGAKFAKDIVVPNITRGRGRTISGSVPLAELGGDGNVDGWSYQVVMQSNEGFPAATDFLTRKVNEYEGQHRFGGGNDGDCDPHAMDVLDGPDASRPRCWPTRVRARRQGREDGHAEDGQEVIASPPTKESTP
jgi:hypothetical protein